MVRLKVNRANLPTKQNSNFNSTMVRLKEFAEEILSAYKEDFNSTMVRLKDLEKRSNPFANPFQFHYGTIKSATGARYRSFEVQFQFHYGTIKSQARAGFYPDRTLISIPLWYD